MTFSSSQGSGENSFQRTGDTWVSRTHQLPSGVSSAVHGAYKHTMPDSALNDSQSAFYSTVLGRSPTGYPGAQSLQGIVDQDPSVFQGEAALNNFINRNPYSTDYENAIGALYDRMYNTARAGAISGPANVRGGQARQGFELADLDTQQSINKFREVRGQQDKEAGVVQGAIQLFNTIESMRRGQQMQGQQQQVSSEGSRVNEGLGAASGLDRSKTTHLANLQLAAELLGIPMTKTYENLFGQGNQNGSTMGFAPLQCCFIFLEATNGRLPWYTRLARDYFATPRRIHGYRWMSTWLVPAMKRSGVVKWLVNAVMVKPFLSWGHSLYISRRLNLWMPLCWCWFHLWSFLGWLHCEKEV